MSGVPALRKQRSSNSAYAGHNFSCPKNTLTVSAKPHPKMLVSPATFVHAIHAEPDDNCKDLVHE